MPMVNSGLKGLTYMRFQQHKGRRNMFRLCSLFVSASATFALNHHYMRVSHCWNNSNVLKIRGRKTAQPTAVHIPCLSAVSFSQQSPKSRTNVGLMLGHRLRRRPSIKPAAVRVCRDQRSVQCIFALLYYYCSCKHGDHYNV